MAKTAFFTSPTSPLHEFIDFPSFQWIAALFGTATRKAARYRVEFEARQVMDKLCVLSGLSAFFVVAFLLDLFARQPRHNLAFHGIESIYSAPLCFSSFLARFMSFFCVRVLEKLHNIPKAAGTTRDVSKLIGVPLLIFQFFIVINAMQFAYILYSQFLATFCTAIWFDKFLLCVFIRNSSYLYLTSANSWHKKLWTVIAVRSSARCTGISEITNLQNTKRQQKKF